MGLPRKSKYAATFTLVFLSVTVVSFLCKHDVVLQQSRNHQVVIPVLQKELSLVTENLSLESTPPLGAGFFSTTETSRATESTMATDAPWSEPVVNQPFGGEPTKNQTSGSEPTGNQTLESEPTWDQIFGSELTENQPFGSEPTGSRTLGSERAENQTFPSVPAENQPFDSQPTGSRTLGSERTENQTFPSEPAGNQTFLSAPTGNYTLGSDLTGNQTFGREPTGNQTFRRIPMDMLEHMAPEIIKFIGRERLQNFRNPCWYEADGKMRCVPYFFLLGVTKCGTSDIWNKTVQHPEICASRKESHWWTQHRSGTLARRDASFTKYREMGLELLDTPNDTHPMSIKVIADGTPSTFWDNHNWRTLFPTNTEGPPYVVADQVHEVVPEAKLIVTFRDPVERQYSSYNFFKSYKNISPARFHEGIVMRMRVWESCMSTNSLRACAYQDNVNARFVDRGVYTWMIGIGIYYIYLEDWLSVYPREQMFFIELKDWQHNCTTVLPQLYQFLELAPLTAEKIREICRTEVKNKARTVIQPMLNSTRKLLQNFYQPFNERFYGIMQDDRFKWDYSS